MGGTGTDRGLRKLPAGSAAVGDDIRRLNGSSRGGGMAESGGAAVTGDLFAWGARQKRFRRTGSLSVRQSSRVQGAYGIERPSGFARRDRRLGRYLYSGSFGTSSPVVRAGHDVQRNRAIFLVVVALLALFVVIRLLSE